MNIFKLFKLIIQSVNDQDVYNLWYLLYFKILILKYYYILVE